MPKMELSHIAFVALLCMVPCFGQTNVCNKLPCENGGSCSVDSTNSATFKCTCKAGFEGNLCQNKEQNFNFEMDGATVVIGVVSGIMILFSIILVLVICCALKRRRFHRHDKFMLYDNMSVDTNHADHVNFNRAYTWQSDHKKTMNNVVIAPSPTPAPRQSASVPEGYVTKVNMNDRIPMTPAPTPAIAPAPSQYQQPGSISVFSTFTDVSGHEKTLRVA